METTIRVFPVGGFAEKLNTELVNAYYKKTTSNIRIVFATGRYLFRETSILFFAPGRKITIECEQGVVFEHHRLGGSLDGVQKSNRGCFYVLCEEFEWLSPATFDFAYGDEWRIYSRFIELRCPRWVAKHILPGDVINEYKFATPQKEYIETRLTRCHIGNQTIVDSTNASKSRHRAIFGHRPLKDRWFMVARHRHIDELYLEGNRIYCHGTELIGGMGRVRRLAIVENSHYGLQDTTGSAFGALLRTDSEVEIDVANISGNFVARQRSRFSAIGNDGNDLADVYVKELFFMDNVGILDANPDKFATMLRIKAKSLGVGVILATNNVFVLNRNVAIDRRPRLFSIASQSDTPGTLFDRDNVVLGETYVDTFVRYSMDPGTVYVETESVL